MRERAEPLLSPAALDDLDEIWAFVAASNERSADRLVRELYELILTIGNNPTVGHRHADLPPEVLIRRLRRWMVLYRVVRDRVEVVRIVGGWRDLRSLPLR